MAIGYSKEGEIRAVMRRYGLPEHEIDHVLDLPDRRYSIAWFAEYAVAWQANQKVKVDILTSFGYNIEEASLLAQNYRGRPSLEWASDMAMKRDRPKNLIIFSILLVSGVIMLSVSGYFQSEIIEILFVIGGFLLIGFSIAGLLSLLPKSKNNA